MIHKNNLRTHKNNFSCRGQVSVLFAALIPLLFLVLGVVLDLGWYYLNVSRLQNAADAAAVAGAQTLIAEGQNFSAYKNIALVKKYPARVSNEYRSDTNSEKEAITNSNAVAKKYVAKNLSGASYEANFDAWTKTEIQSEQKLYEKDDNLYYVVKLSEEIRHFFLPGWFDDMNAPVTAVALLSKNALEEVVPPEVLSSSDSILPEIPDMLIPERPTTQDNVGEEETLETVMEDAKNSNVIVGNWEVQKYYKYLDSDSSSDTYTNSTGTLAKMSRSQAFEERFGFAVYTNAWNHFQDVKNHYKIPGATYRTETINVWDDVVDKDNDGSVDSWGNGQSGMSNVVATEASSNPDKIDNKGKPYTWDK